MPRLLSRYATPLITGLFLVSLISGVALYLGLGQGAFREMHETLSMVLIIPFVLHLWKNWRSVTSYLGRFPMTAALSVSAVAAIGFALGSLSGGAGEREGPPQFAFTSAMLENSPAELAPLLGTTPEGLTQQLTQAGFTVADPAEPLTQVATDSGRNEFELVQALLPAAS